MTLENLLSRQLQSQEVDPDYRGNRKTLELIRNPGPCYVQVVSQLQTLHTVKRHRSKENCKYKYLQKSFDLSFF